MGNSCLICMWFLKQQLIIEPWKEKNDISPRQNYFQASFRSTTGGMNTLKIHQDEKLGHSV